MFRIDPRQVLYVFKLLFFFLCRVIGTKNETSCSPPTLEQWLDFPGSSTEFVPFQSMQFAWESAGHEPEGIYTVPHFDFHFYYTTEGYVQANIPPGKVRTLI